MYIYIYKYVCGVSQPSTLFFLRSKIPSKDLILLDEPTNHVDLETVEFMEHLLRQQEVAMVVVSHDRYFLNQVCNLSMNGCCNFFVGGGLMISNNLAEARLS